MSLYGGREHLGEEDSEQQPRRSQRQRTLTEKGQAFRADLLVGKVEDLRVQLLSLIEDAEEGLRLPVIDTPAMINRHKETNIGENFFDSDFGGVNKSNLDSDYVSSYFILKRPSVFPPKGVRVFVWV